MHITTEGIVLRQVKILKGKQMLSIFTRKYGLISVVVNSSSKAKNKTSLTMRPFTYSIFQLIQKNEYYTYSSGEVKRDFYKISDEMDKFIAASYVLELTSKLLAEHLPNTELFDLLIKTLDIIERRKKEYDTLVLAYQIKALKCIGSSPMLDHCVKCNSVEITNSFSIIDGGMICEKCIKHYPSERLIFSSNFDIIKLLIYMREASVDDMLKIGLKKEIAYELKVILREYINYHLDIKNLKSESMFYI